MSIGAFPVVASYLQYRVDSFRAVIRITRAPMFFFSCSVRSGIGCLLEQARWVVVQRACPSPVRQFVAEHLSAERTIPGSG
jgi:hypothetical protein